MASTPAPAPAGPRPLPSGFASVPSPASLRFRLGPHRCPEPCLTSLQPRPPPWSPAQPRLASPLPSPRPPDRRRPSLPRRSSRSRQGLARPRPAPGRSSRWPTAPASPSAAAVLLLLRARRWFRSHKMAALTAATSVPAAAVDAGEWGRPPEPRPRPAAARTRRFQEWECCVGAICACASHLCACALPGRSPSAPGPPVSREGGVGKLKTYFVVTSTEARANPGVPERQQPGCQTPSPARGSPRTGCPCPRIVETVATSGRPP